MKTILTRYEELRERNFMNIGRENSYLGDEVVRKIKAGVIKFGDSGINEGIVDMVLLGIALPKVYFTEDVMGYRHCIFGGEVLSTVFNILEDAASKASPFVYNKFYQVNIPFVTLEPSSSVHSLEIVTSLVKTLSTLKV